jgi:hypothetical protein
VSRIGESGVPSLPWFGVRGAMRATTGLLPLTATFIVFSPQRRLRTLPTGRADREGALAGSSPTSTA